MTDEQLHTSHLSSFIMFFSLFFIYFFSPFVFCYFSFMYHFALAFIRRAIEAATRSTHARHSRPGVTISFFFHQTLLLGSFLPSRLFSTRSMCVCTYYFFYVYLASLPAVSLSDGRYCLQLSRPFLMASSVLRIFRHLIRLEEGKSLYVFFKCL